MGRLFQASFSAKANLEGMAVQAAFPAAESGPSSVFGAVLIPYSVGILRGISVEVKREFT